MKNYGNKTIAKAGFYLVASDGRRGFALTDKEGVTYEELYLDTNVEERPYNCVCIGGVFQMQKSDNMKRDLVNLVFSNDDQIAIILNRDDSEEDAEMFEFMQEWREWFGNIVKNIKLL